MSVVFRVYSKASDGSWTPDGEFEAGLVGDGSEYAAQWSAVCHAVEIRDCHGISAKVERAERSPWSCGHEWGVSEIPLPEPEYAGGATEAEESRRERWEDAQS